MSTVVKPVIIICPNLRCRTVLSVPATVRGKKVRCGQCGTSFLVPATPAEASGPSAK